MKAVRVRLTVTDKKHCYVTYEGDLKCHIIEGGQVMTMILRGA